MSERERKSERGSARATRTGKADWLQQGLAILRDGGEAKLTIERLCQALERTKGAFYHHFPDINAFEGELLALWEERNTSAPIAAANLEADPLARRKRLHEVVRTLDWRLDLALRAWALRDPRAAKVLARVDERRIGYLMETGHPAVQGEARARKLARLEYAAFLGAQQLFPGPTGRAGAEAKDLELTLREAIKLLANRKG